MPLDTTMLLRLKFAADIKKKGITNMKHYLKQWCLSYQDIRSKQQQMYHELNLPITYTVQGNPATKVNGPDYVAKFLSVPHWQQRCIVRKNAAGRARLGPDDHGVGPNPAYTALGWDLRGPTRVPPEYVGTCVSGAGAPAFPRESEPQWR